MPELTNDVPSLPFKQGWGLGLHLLLEDVPDMRRAGTGDWAGLFNCYYWVDPATRDHRGDLHAAAPLLRRTRWSRRCSSRSRWAFTRRSARPLRRSRPGVANAAAVTATAGYSGTPLPKKLGIKEGSRLALVAAPDGFLESTLAPLPDQVELRARARGPARRDRVLHEVPRRPRAPVREARGALDPAGALWIAWPKRVVGRRRPT